MEFDRQFVQLLDQLREAHQSLGIEHRRKVAKLEAEVARLRGSPVQAPAANSEAGAPSSRKVDDDDDVCPINTNEVEEDCEAGTPDNHQLNIASTMDTLTENTQDRKNAYLSSEDMPAETKANSRHTSHLALKRHNETILERRWARFDGFIGFAIILYTAVMYLGLHLEGIVNEKRLVNEPPPDLGGLSDFVDGMNHCFNLLFLVEFLIRICCFRGRYFYDRGIQWFNLFDATLVWLTIFEAYVLNSMSLNVSFIRVVRIIRLLRSLRVVRTLRFFNALRILVATVASSFLALFWSMVLLCIVMLMGALALCQLLGSSINDGGIDIGVRTWVNRYYGSPGRSLYTMFELTFSGCWPNYARTLIEEVSALYVFFFAFYIAGVVFAMTRIITALFLKDTLAIANTDADMQINAKMKEKQAYASKLQEFFEEADVSGDGFITKAEFMAMLQEPRAAAYLSYLELDCTESLHLFQVIDDGDGRISCDEFVKSALRLKGCARAQDVVILMHELYKVKRHVKDMHLVTSGLCDTVHGMHSKVHKIHAFHCDPSGHRLVEVASSSESLVQV